MSGLWLLLLGSFAPAFVQQASLEVGSDSVEVGDAVVVELTARESLPTQVPGAGPLDIERAARAALRRRFGPKLFKEGTLDYSWVVLDAEPLVIRRVSGEENGGELVARRSFRLVSLEAGERILPLPDFDGELESVMIAFTSMLAAEEDAPRPPLGFRPLPSEVETAPRASWQLPAISGTFLLVFVGIVLWRKRNRRKSSPLTTPRTTLAGLVETTLAEGATPEMLRAAHFQATALLRKALDTTLCEPGQPGATDEEWLALSKSRLGLDEAAFTDLERFFKECSEVKYGGASATEWGLAERIETALRCLQVEVQR